MIRRISLILSTYLVLMACTMGVIEQEALTPTPPPPVWSIYTNGNDVHDLAFDQQGNLWAGTSGGLVKWMADGTYKKYTTLDGLPDNQVWGVATTPDGAVWVGTFDGGLARFEPSPGSGQDGTQWTIYTTSDGLPDNRAWDVATAPDGTVWVSTYASGVTRFENTNTPGHTWTTFTIAQGLPSNDVHDIATALDGAVWITTADCNVSYFDPSTGSGHNGAHWTTHTFGGDTTYICPNTIAPLPGGAAWVSTTAGLSYFDGVDWQTYTNDDLGNIYAVTAADDGSVWGTSQYGIFHFTVDASGEAWTVYPIARPDDTLLDNITLAPDGSVWVSKRILHQKTRAWIGQGISRFDGSQWTEYVTDDELGASRVDNTVKTNDGMLWFFTEGGVSCYNEGWVPCPGDGVGIDISPSVTRAPDGAFWSLTHPGVSRFDGETWTTYDDFPGASLGNLTIAPNGLVWVGTYSCAMRTGCTGHGVARFDGASWAIYVAADGLADDFVNDIAVADDGAVWFATRGGTSRLDGEMWTTYDLNTIFPANDLPYNEVRRVITTPDGLVCCELIGTVSCFDGQAWTAYTEVDGLYVREGVGLNTILSTAVEQDGTLWVGTNEGGISHFDGETWTTYTVADGLGDNQINTIAVAPDGAIWVGTLYGVSRFDGASWTNLTTADGGPSKNNGLADNIVYDIVVAPDGALWFSTYSGVSRYGPPK